MTEDELTYILDLINHRPRKCLGWKTSDERLWKICRTWLNNLT